MKIADEGRRNRRLMEYTTVQSSTLIFVSDFRAKKVSPATLASRCAGVEKSSMLGVARGKNVLNS
jgi:hypothetical protein